jgi:hypothetical protein
MTDVSHRCWPPLLAAFCLLASLGGLPAAAQSGTCGSPPPYPNDPDYASAERGDASKTWNDEQWYLYSCLPSDAPGATDPEGASGMSVDRVWNELGDRGRDEVIVAYMEGGVNWRLTDSPDLRLRAHLNTGELPLPEDASGVTHGTYDLNGDGVVNVDDYADDPRVPRPFLHPGAGGITAEDMIVAFSDGRDDDGNGYVDDISGWNFHRDTNDPQTDNSVYGHANGESRQAVGETDNALLTAGMCPKCRLLTVKAGDEAIDRPDRVAEAITFAVDSGAKVITSVIASLGLTPEVAKALRYAYDRGVVVAWASNDFDSADHTDGMFYPHVWPGNSIVGDQSTRGQQSPSVTSNRTYRSRSTLTSFGPHALFSVPNNDGSTSTGTPTQAGVAALVITAGLDAVQAGEIAHPLAPDEVKQVVRSTVSPIDDPTLPFPGLPGATFNVQYGYGRPNVFRAVQAVHAGQIPPTADILEPAWYQEVDPTVGRTLKISSAIAARNPGRYGWRIDYGFGPQPLESDFVRLHSGHSGRPRTVRAKLRFRNIPSSFWGGDLAVTSDRLSIERYDVTVRVRVTDALGLVGEDRRAFHLRHDAAEVAGFPVYFGSSGESSPTIADLEGRGTLDVVVATASGAVHVVRADGKEAPGFPVFTGPAPGMDPSSDVNYLAVPRWRDNPADRPLDGMAAPTAVGDIDGDGQLDIVATTMSGRTYAWRHDGTLLPGFPVETDRAFAHQVVPTPDTPYHRNRSTGALASPVLVDLDGDGKLDVVQAAWDGHVYAWHGDGTAVAGWPVDTDYPALRPSGQTYARDDKVVTTPAVADIDGDGTPDLVVALQDTSWPSSSSPSTGPISAYLLAFYGQGTARANGGLVTGFPVALQGLVQGYGTAQDFITEGLTSPVVFDLPTGPVAVVAVNLFDQYLVDLRTRVTRQFANAALAQGGPLIPFTTSPSAGDLLGTGLPQIAQSGSSAGDILTGVVEAPGLGIQVHSGVGVWDPSTGNSLSQYSQPIQGLGFIGAPALADVSGDGVPDVIQATDSAALHAWDGATGQPVTGFPKWTGGFSVFTPAVGDLDCDGRLEVVLVTREGYLHAFRSDGLASATRQAWHWHQDNRNTGHWGSDAGAGEGRCR